MKKIFIFTLALSLILSFTACGKTEAPKTFENAEDVAEYLLKSNEVFLDSKTNSGDISVDKREDTAENGQTPYAVIVTCSDSRVPAEHIFNAGIGELFVIRTAGNVIGDYELGSVEYGAEHLQTKLVVVLGHTNCGAVDAALSGGAHGYIKEITDEISSCLPEDCDARTAEILNVQNSVQKIMESHIMQTLVSEGSVEVRGAIYDIATGKVEFLP